MCASSPHILSLASELLLYVFVGAERVWDILFQLQKKRVSVAGQSSPGGCDRCLQCGGHGSVRTNQATIRAASVSRNENLIFVGMPGTLAAYSGSVKSIGAGCVRVTDFWLTEALWLSQRLWSNNFGESRHSCVH